MSEPIKKPNQVPDSHSPKKPEILLMTEQRNVEDSMTAINNIDVASLETKNSVDFTIKFCGFYETDFINCFAAVYMYLEGEQGENDPYYYLFDTMCGHSSIRFPYDGGYFDQTKIQKLIGHTKEDENGNDYTVDFLFGFAGYEYQKLSDPSSFKEAVINSINAGKPVIAKIKLGEWRYRVITGYNGDELLEPNYKESNMRNSGEPASYDIINTLYIVDKKIQPRYTLIDGLERIHQVMEFNVNDKPWESYISKLEPRPLEHIDDSYINFNVEEIEMQLRMKRLYHTMWPSMNSHCFVQAFDRLYSYADLQNPVVLELWEQITNIYKETLNLYWSLIFLSERADWKHPAFENWQIGTIIKITLEKIQKNDEDVFEIIKRIITILNKETTNM